MHSAHSYPMTAIAKLQNPAIAINTGKTLYQHLCKAFTIALDRTGYAAGAVS